MDQRITRKILARYNSFLTQDSKCSERTGKKLKDSLAQEPALKFVRMHKNSFWKCRKPLKTKAKRRGKHIRNLPLWQNLSPKTKPLQRCPISSNKCINLSYLVSNNQVATRILISGHKWLTTRQILKTQPKTAKLREKAHSLPVSSLTLMMREKTQEGSLEKW